MTNIESNRMTMRGYQVMKALDLTHLPKTKITITYHLTHTLVIVEPVNPLSTSSYSHYNVEMIDLPN